MSIEQAVAELADQVDVSEHSAIFLLRDIEAGTPTSVYVSENGDQMRATLAMAIDENPSLIALFVDALEMVQDIGNNKNAPAFARVFFRKGAMN